MLHPASPSEHRGPPWSTRQAAVLAELRTLYAAEGFADVSLDDVAARVACSKTTLYALGGTRAELDALVVNEHFRTGSARVEAAVAATSGSAARLRAYLAGVAGETRAVSNSFLVDLNRVPSARRVYEHWVGVVADRVRALIDEGVAASEFRSVNAEFLGQVATAVIRDIEWGDLQQRARLSQDAAYEHLAETLIRAASA